MKLVFDHIDFTLVGHLQSILEGEGIRTEIRNLNASSAAGAIPVAQVYPEIWVLDNRDEARARALIHDFLESSPRTPPGPDWVCPLCHETVDGVFSECWNCSTPRP